MSLLLKDILTPMVTICCFSCSDCNNPLIMTLCCSNESILNNDFRTLVKALDLAHCATWTVLPSVWKYRYYFTGKGSVDEFFVVLVVIVSPKQEELQLFYLGVSNEYEPSLSLTGVFPLCLVLWSDTKDSK